MMNMHKNSRDTAIEISFIRKSREGRNPSAVTFSQLCGTTCVSFRML